MYVMCGIVGYVGRKKHLPVVLGGLKRLEYRGYDSAGVAAAGPARPLAGLFHRKAKGKVADLEKLLNGVEGDFSASVGHTRWATHGAPSNKNAHPHFDCGKKIALVHNGIIENHKELKARLLKKGHKFLSETDTEVAAHLIEEFFKKTGSFEDAFELALKCIKGTYAFAVISADKPGIIAVARNSSPLLLGLGKGENFAASDASAVLPYTRRVIYLNDGEYAFIGKDSIDIRLDGRGVKKKSRLLDWSAEESSKGGFRHFMLKEIFEEPRAVENALRGRLIMSEGAVKLGGLESVWNKASKLERIVISACGTAYFAGLAGKYLLEELAGIPVEVEFSSELRYRNPVFNRRTALLCVSQSGETADTLAALREAKRKGLLSLGVVNVVGSTLSRETDAGVYNHAGPEIGVASTKAFVSQLAVLVLLSVFLGRQRSLTLSRGREITAEIARIPAKMDRILKQNALIKKLALKYRRYKNFLYLGRKFNFPIALEGALKLKEISYIHAEGYGAGEMKHGPIAMIDSGFPSIVIAPRDGVYEKVLSNIQEIKARGGPVLAVATRGDKEILKLADDVIHIPETLEQLYPFLTVLPLHLFAYHLAVSLGRDVDKPRNLAKSVTVE